MRARHPEFGRLGVHQPRKARLGAVGRECLGEHDAGIVAREHDHAAQQVLDPDTVGRVEEHGRATEA